MFVIINRAGAVASGIFLLGIALVLTAVRLSDLGELAGGGGSALGPGSPAFRCIMLLTAAGLTAFFSIPRAGLAGWGRMLTGLACALLWAAWMGVGAPGWLSRWEGCVMASMAQSFALAGMACRMAHAASLLPSREELRRRRGGP